LARFTIAIWLAVLFLTLVTPTIIFVVFLINELEGADRATLERRTLREAVSTSRAVEPVIEGMRATLNLLLTYPELADNKFEAFHQRAKGALEASNSYVIVVGNNNEQLLNTRIDFGTRLSDVPAKAGVGEALRKDGKPHVTDVFFGKTSEKWVFNVIAPLNDKQAPLARAVITTKDAEELLPIIRSSALAMGWVSLVVDGKSQVIVSSNDHLFKTGDDFEIPTGLKLEKLTGNAGVMTLEGADPQLFAYSHVANTDWMSVVFGPVKTAQAPLSETWKALIIGSVMLIVFSVVVLYFFTNYLRRGIQAIATMADDLAKGEIVSPATSRVKEIDLVSRALSDASFDRSEKDEKIVFIMRELAHRTKNLIAVVNSIIRQTGKNVETKDELVKAVSARVIGLGHSIDLLTSKKWGGVPLQELIEKQLSTFGPVTKNITISGPGILLKAEAVQNLGMVLHELSTNAAKYGALSTEKGRLTLTWEIIRHEDDGDRFKLIWRESRVAKIKKPAATGFGTQIIERHTAAVFNGKSDVKYGDDGLIWSLEAPLEQFGEPE